MLEIVQSGFDHRNKIFSLFANRTNISDIQITLYYQITKNKTVNKLNKIYSSSTFSYTIIQFIMIEQQEQPFDMSVNQTLIELHNLRKIIDSAGNQSSFKAITSFVDLYIHHEKDSQQFFIALCEYSILPRLFGAVNKSIPSLQILQTFNLLLANTSKIGQIVFIFSQPALHEFLFFKFDIESQNSQTIEYYVQLLKTIIMKISSEKQQSLIKLFCNNRFPHFPLLTAITSLASNYEQQDLTRVTANQCFLLLVNVMNQTKIGIEYLSELQTIIYYHQLITNFLNESEDQQKETIRFIVDLIFNLRNNVISTVILMNLLTNHIIFTNIGEPYRTLRFITDFYQHMLQNKEFPVQLAEEIILVLFTIVSKYYNGTLFTNYTYHSSQKIIPSLQIPQKPSLDIFFEQRCRKIQNYLILERPLFEQQKQLEFVKQQWEHLVMNVTSSRLKQRVPKSKSKFVTFFTSKDQLVSDYVKAIMTKAGISEQKIHQPIYKLSVTTDYQTALYLVQLVITKFGLDYKLKAKKTQQKYEKEQMWMLNINQRLLIQIYRICRKTQKMQLESSRIKLQKEYHKESGILKAQGFIYFLQSMKNYFKNSFISLLSNISNKIEISQLTLISAISSRINLREMLDPQSIRFLLNKLQQLQAFISEDVFSQQNFHFILKYICKGKQKSLLKKIDRNKQCDSPLSSRKKFYQIRTRIQTNFILYEVIKRIIDSSVKSLSDFIQQYWKARFFSEKGGLSYPVTQFLYRDVNGSVLQVLADKNYEFCLKKSKKDKQSITYSISRQDCMYDSQNPSFLSFEGNQFFLDLQTEQKARNFREDLQRLRKAKTELIMNGIIEYLSFSYQCLQSYCNLKSSKFFNLKTPK